MASADGSIYVARDSPSHENGIAAFGPLPLSVLM